MSYAGETPTVGQGTKQSKRELVVSSVEKHSEAFSLHKDAI